MRLRLTRAFYEPKEFEQKIERPDLTSVVYIDSLKHNGKPWAIGFSGKRSKPDFNHTYSSPEARERYVTSYFEALKRSADYKEKHKALQKVRKAELAATFKPGSLLCASWGYEQTNVDFYKVLDVKGMRLLIAPCGAKSVRGNSWASDYVVADPSIVLENKAIWKRVGSWGVKLDSSRTLRPYDGKEQYRSWYA